MPATNQASMVFLIAALAIADSGRLLRAFTEMEQIKRCRSADVHGFAVSPGPPEADPMVRGDDGGNAT